MCVCSFCESPTDSYIKFNPIPLYITYVCTYIRIFYVDITHMYVRMYILWHVCKYLCTACTLFMVINYMLLHVSLYVCTLIMSLPFFFRSTNY